MAENYLDILAETIRNNWDQPALTDFYLTEDGTAQDTSRGNHYTYGEMYAEVVRVADLLTRLGLKKGDHIAICGTNSTHWVISYLAIAKMQGVSVTVMHSLQPDEIAHFIDFSDAKALFVDGDLWGELKEQSLPQVQSVIALEDWNVLFGEKQIINHKSKIKNGECGFDSVESNSLAMICFTSGSSGKPKGVMLSYGDLTARVIGTNIACGMLNNRKALAYLPMAHIYSFGGQMLTPIVYGGHIFLLGEVPSATTLFSIVAKIRPYSFFTVPMVAIKLLEIPHHKELVPMLLRGIEYMAIGGAQIPIEVERECVQLSMPFAPAYGLSESCPISMTPYNGYREGTVGKIFNTLKCRISPAGEILVKGENVMLGYYKDPEATAQKIDKDGWLHTGDKGHLDEDGYLYVEGRLEQDMIVLPNGENIRPENIEALINALPDVSESIVLARDGKLVAIVVPQIINHKSEITNSDLRRQVLRQVNPQLPLFSQLYDVEITDVPLQRTEKQTLKRYLYK